MASATLLLIAIITRSAKVLGSGAPGSTFFCSRERFFAPGSTFLLRSAFFCSDNPACKGMESWLTGPGSWYGKVVKERRYVDGPGQETRLKHTPVAWTPHLMNSARLHKVFQNFVVQWKIHININLILSSDASRQDASNGIRVAYVNFYHKLVLRHG